MRQDTLELIRKITEETLKRLSAEESAKSATLAVFPELVFEAQAVAEYLKKNHGDAVCAAYGETGFGYGFKTKDIAARHERENLAAQLRDYERFVLVTPPLRLIRAMADGDDTEYAAALALRALLWGREVTVLLDFEMPQRRRGDALERVAKDIETLEETGVKIVTLSRGDAGGAEPKELVTERDVREAAVNGNKRIVIKPGAIVTHLARDAAAELGVIIGS